MIDQHVSAAGAWISFLKDGTTYRSQLGISFGDVVNGFLQNNDGGASQQRKSRLFMNTVGGRRRVNNGRNRDSKLYLFVILPTLNSEGWSSLP